jgi:hypothetical protein
MALGLFDCGQGVGNELAGCGVAFVVCGRSGGLDKLAGVHGLVPLGQVGLMRVVPVGWRQPA